jgi:murein DD-endopeptidase MepM/ murein hydrolase activator NlpD
MKRRTAVFLALAALCATAPAASARTFTIVSPSAPAAPTVAALPGATQPNGPGAISVPFAMSTAPAQPAVRSYDELRTLWQAAGSEYGIPWQVLAAINKIESNFGRNMGPSSAGAVGWMQFMPSTWMRWGVDADGDGIANPWDPEDAIYAAARYLAAAGGQTDLARAVFAYNHAQWYVDEVLRLAAQFESGDGGFADGLVANPAALRLAALRGEIDQARRAVGLAQRGVPRTEAGLDRLERRELALTRRAGDPSLPVEKFKKLEAQIARNERAQDGARGRLEEQRANLDAAVARLESLRRQIASAAVSAPAAASADSPQPVDGYVFPVGGGPLSVSVSHHHHDYPAADIAAPEGAPVYALADTVVLDTYEDGEGNCGVGVKLQVTDGAQYTYCHLSYREPSVVPGTALAAGAPVGLVGHTGHATGPHLHLQLDPPDRYPQLEPWFQSFAGIAFRWQDAPTPKPRAKPHGPVFTVVSGGEDAPTGDVITFTR